jgi:hypothetical protein
VILIVMCLSKWIDKDNSQGFDICVMQRPFSPEGNVAALIVCPRKISRRAMGGGSRGIISFTP